LARALLLVILPRHRVRKLPAEVRVHFHDALEGLPLDHVAVAVESIDAMLPTLESVTGAVGSPRERVASQGVEACFVGPDPGRLELLQPLGPDTPVGRFLAKRGPGLHHIAYRVTDLDAELRRLETAGIELIDRAPRPGARGHRVAFIHPRSTGGVLIELVEP
jgi:methylmalonyl-CoA/ethylmalonyl-CoA epimerase